MQNLSQKALKAPWIFGKLILKNVQEQDLAQIRHAYSHIDSIMGKIRVIKAQDELNSLLQNVHAYKGQIVQMLGI